MIAVTKIEGTVISIHVHDDGRIVVAQVDPDSGQDYTYRQHFTDYPMAHAAFSTLVTERLERERATMLDVGRQWEQRFSAQARIKSQTLQSAADRLPLGLNSESNPVAAVKRWLQNQAEIHRTAAALWERL